MYRRVNYRQKSFYYIGSSSSQKETIALYYKTMLIINDDSRVVNKLEASFTDDARVVIYNRHMFIVQATSLIQKRSILKLNFRFVQFHSKF
jgi:hypothetical protein